jgi:PKD repeat protein
MKSTKHFMPQGIIFLLTLLFGLGGNLSEVQAYLYHNVRDTNLSNVPADQGGQQCHEFIFDGTESHDPNNEKLKFFWEFGDGTTGEEPILEHTFTKSGEYKVTLTVTNESNLVDKSSKIIQANIPPTAMFEAPAAVCQNEIFPLDASTSTSEGNKELNYLWLMGDGTRKSGETVDMSYAHMGDYVVKLIVNDNLGTACSVDNEERVIHVNVPPVAEAGEDYITRCLDRDKTMTLQFDGSKSSDKNNDKLSYFWDFGDGHEDDGPMVEHTYENGGEYKVKLTVQDNSGTTCAIAEDFVQVNVGLKPKAVAGEDTEVCLGTTVEFDGTGSLIDDSEILFSKWDFGDGDSQQGLILTHEYKRPGVYTAKLTVTAASPLTCPEGTDTRQVTVISAPKFSIQPHTKTHCIGDEVAFDATSPIGQDAIEYFWNFGNGTIQKGGPKISHKFSEGGTYKVSVIADDKRGTACSSATDTVFVKVNTSPVADPGENTGWAAGIETEFSALKSHDLDGDELTYKWDFGDGNTSHLAETSHIYEKLGDYPVLLTVSDNSGSTCSTSTAGFTAEIRESPVSVIKVRKKGQ